MVKQGIKKRQRLNWALPLHFRYVLLLPKDQCGPLRGLWPFSAIE